MIHDISYSPFFSFDPTSSSLKGTSQQEVQLCTPLSCPGQYQRTDPSDINQLKNDLELKCLIEELRLAQSRAMPYGHCYHSLHVADRVIAKIEDLQQLGSDLKADDFWSAAETLISPPIEPEEWHQQFLDLSAPVPSGLCYDINRRLLKEFESKGVKAYLCPIFYFDIEEGAPSVNKRHTAVSLPFTLGDEKVHYLVVDYVHSPELLLCSPGQPVVPISALRHDGIKPQLQHIAYDEKLPVDTDTSIWTIKQSLFRDPSAVVGTFILCPDLINVAPWRDLVFNFKNSTVMRSIRCDEAGWAWAGLVFYPESQEMYPMIRTSRSNPDGYVRKGLPLDCGSLNDPLARAVVADLELNQEWLRSFIERLQRVSHLLPKILPSANPIGKQMQ